LKYCTLIKTIAKILDKIMKNKNLRLCKIATHRETEAEKALNSVQNSIFGHGSAANVKWFSWQLG
jgi:hypothetical protein